MHAMVSSTFSCIPCINRMVVGVASFVYVYGIVMRCETLRCRKEVLRGICDVHVVLSNREIYKGVAWKLSRPAGGFRLLPADKLV